MDNSVNKQMYEVDLKCAKCGAKITQLPFQPSGDRPVYCFECTKLYRQQNQTQNNGEKKMYDVDVNCSKCGAKITKLPFVPRSSANIICKDCYIKSRN